MFHNSFGICLGNILILQLPSNRTILLTKEVPLHYLKKFNLRVTSQICFITKEVFHNPFGIHLEFIWKTFCNMKYFYLPSNNTLLKTFEISLSVKKKSIKWVPSISKLIETRCSEKQLEIDQIHLVIPEYPQPWKSYKYLGLPFQHHTLFLCRVTPTNKCFSL